MKRIFLSVAVVLGCAVCMARADDVAEVRKVFDQFVQYQKANDARLLDEYVPAVSVTLVFDTGKETRDMVLPADQFRALVAQDLAKKRENKESYEDVMYAQEGDTVKVTGIINFGDQGKRGPFLAVYGKDGSGHFKVKALKVTIPVDALPAGN